MRKFINVIFQGGQLTGYYNKKLHDRLNEALEILSGLQQPLMSTNDPDKEEDTIQRLKLGNELKDAIEDIMIALGYNEYLGSREN